MTSKDNYCVIMGGGIGSRFWPFSRKTMPKQFLDFFGTYSKPFGLLSKELACR